VVRDVDSVRASAAARGLVANGSVMLAGTRVKLLQSQDHLVAER
jgi:hypothetical protein